MAFTRLAHGSASNESAYHSFGCQKNKTGNGHLKSMSILFCSCMEYMYADENSIHLIEFILHWNNFPGVIYREIHFKILHEYLWWRFRIKSRCDFLEKFVKLQLIKFISNGEHILYIKLYCLNKLLDKRA